MPVSIHLQYIDVCLICAFFPIYIYIYIYFFICISTCPAQVKPWRCPTRARTRRRSLRSLRPETSQADRLGDAVADLTAGAKSRVQSEKGVSRHRGIDAGLHRLRGRRQRRRRRRETKSHQRRQKQSGAAKMPLKLQQRQKARPGQGRPTMLMKRSRLVNTVASR